MILRIDVNGSEHEVDIGDVSSMSSDDKTVALHTAMTNAGLDVNTGYIIIEEVIVEDEEVV